MPVILAEPCTLIMFVLACNCKFPVALSVMPDSDKLPTFKLVNVPRVVKPGALLTVLPKAVLLNTVTPFILYSLPVAKLKCSELFKEDVEFCHNNVLFVAVDLITMPPPSM